MAYWLAGLTLKFGDDLLDELDRPDYASFPLAISGVLFGLLMTLNIWDFVLLAAIVIGVVLSGKVNKPQFLIGFIMIGSILMLRGVPPVVDWAMPLAFIIALLVAAVVDEIGNDWADRGERRFLSYFFQYRFTLKVLVLLLSIIVPDFFPRAVGLWIFDFGYESAGMAISKKFRPASHMQDYNKHL